MIKTRYKIQEYFSKETKIHCNRVEQYTKAMAEELRLSAYDTKMLTVAARYHDIGKYYIPEKILNAPRPLTGLERKVIDMHAYYGYEACMEYGLEKDICELILLHHGTHKYRTLTDEQISDFAKEYFQILMAADIYDALISDRVYRRAMGVSCIRKNFTMLGLRYCSQHDIIELYFYQTLEYRKILNIFKNQVNRKLSIMGIN